MSGAHDYLRGILFGSATGGVTGHPWTGILAAMDGVTSARSEESELLLRRLLTDFHRPLPLDPDAGFAHAMPPEDLLRSLAVQTLAEWDLHRHRDVIQPHADPARHDILGSIARRALSA
jgi:hypothetical protein